MMMMVVGCCCNCTKFNIYLWWKTLQDTQTDGLTDYGLLTPPSSMHPTFYVPVTKLRFRHRTHYLWLF